MNLFQVVDPASAPSDLPEDMYSLRDVSPKSNPEIRRRAPGRIHSDKAKRSSDMRRTASKSPKRSVSPKRSISPKRSVSPKSKAPDLVEHLEDIEAFCQVMKATGSEKRSELIHGAMTAAKKSSPDEQKSRKR